MKKTILKIMFWSAVALIIPILGNQFVEGWNWSLGDFVFAWVFFVIMSLSIRFAIRRAANPKYKVLIGTAVFLVFLFIWVVLATG
jgi:hypothetical protein